MAEETTARRFLIAALLLGAVIAGTFSIISLGLPADNSDFTSYNTTLNKFNDIRSESENTAARLRDTDTDGGVLGMLNGLIQNAWGTLKLVFKSLDLFTSLVNNGRYILGIPLPYFFIGLITTIIVIGVVFALIAAIFKWNI